MFPGKQLCTMTENLYRLCYVHVTMQNPYPSLTAVFRIIMAVSGGLIMNPNYSRLFMEVQKLILSLFFNFISFILIVELLLGVVVCADQLYQIRSSF